MIVVKPARLKNNMLAKNVKKYFLTDDKLITCLGWIRDSFRNSREELPVAEEETLTEEEPFNSNETFTSGETVSSLRSTYRCQQNIEKELTMLFLILVLRSKNRKSQGRTNCVCARVLIFQ